MTPPGGQLRRDFAIAFVGSFLAAFSVSAALGAAVAWMVTRAPVLRLETPTFDMTLPSGWRCEFDASLSPMGAYSCTKPEVEASSLVVIAMKRRDPGDNLASYEMELGRRDLWGAKQGEPTLLKPIVKSMSRVQLSGFEWVDAFVFGREIEGWYTRFLATNTAHIGLLISFSAEQHYYEQTKVDFETMIRSLIVHQK